MRFVVLVVGGAAAGALAVGAERMMVPQNSQMFQAVRALAGNVTSIKLADLNPRKAYDEVMRKVTSGSLSNSFNFGTSAPGIASSPSFSKVGNLGLGGKLQIDEASFKRAWASGIASQIQQNNRRMQDMSTYARNPTGWHGAPP